MIIVYPKDYFDATKADDIYEEERQIAQQLSIPYVLFDFDSKRPVSTTFAMEDISPDEFVVYRGWQVSPDEYEHDIYPLLCQYGRPLTSPQEYATMHSTDGYYDYVWDYLPDAINASYDELMSNDGEIIPSIFDDLGDKIFVKE